MRKCCVWTCYLCSPWSTFCLLAHQIAEQQLVIHYRHKSSVKKFTWKIISSSCIKSWKEREKGKKRLHKLRNQVFKHCCSLAVWGVMEGSMGNSNRHNKAPCVWPGLSVVTRTRAIKYQGQSPEGTHRPNGPGQPHLRPAHTPCPQAQELWLGSTLGLHSPPELCQKSVSLQLSHVISHGVIGCVSELNADLLA